MNDKEGGNNPAGAIVTWSASESVDHERGKVWYLAMILVVVAVIGLSIWMGQWTLGLLALVIAAAIILVVRKPAREIKYTLSPEGLSIDGKLHGFEEFRAFGVRRESALWQLVLIPVGRFGMALTVFINEDQGEEIVDTVGSVLPMENIKPDLVDNLTRWLKL